MRPFRWLVCGLVLIGIYRVMLHAGILIFDELKGVVGQQPMVGNLCAAIGIGAYGAFAELFFRCIRRER